jgi:hypothetical protein
MECRRSAERFTPDRVAARYEQMYQTAIEAAKRRDGVRQRATADQV